MTLSMSGWVVELRIGIGAGRVTRYYLAAISDPAAALEAVRCEVGGDCELRLGSEISQQQLAHRKVAEGSVRLLKRNGAYTAGDRARIARRFATRIA